MARCLGLCVLLLTGSLCAAVETAPAFKLKQVVPEGFEDIDVEETTMVDVYFGGKLVTSALARFDAELISFDDPGQVADALDILEAHRDEVSTALTGDLFTNQHSLCREVPEPGCGTVNPEVAELVFDPLHYRVNVFVNPRFVPTEYVDDGQPLPPPQSGLSSTASFKAVISGGSDNSSYRLSSDFTASMGRTSLKMRLGYDAVDSLAVDAVSLLHEGSSWAVDAGALTQYSTVTGLVKTQDFDGIRWRSSLRTRGSLQMASATPVFVFLTERSRVDLFRDDKLEQTVFLDAGNHQVDTSGLPDGVYTLKVRITNSLGVEEAKQSFSRIMALPPKGMARHFIEAGRYQEDGAGDILTFSGTDFFSAGSTLRLTETIGLDFSYQDDQNKAQILQANIVAYASRGLLSAGLVDSNGLAHQLSMTYQDHNWSFALNHKGAALSRDEDASSTWQQIQGKETSLSLSTSALGGNLRLKYQHRSPGANDVDKESTGLTYSRNLFRKGKYHLDFRGEYLADEEDRKLLLALRLGARQQRSRFSVDLSKQDSELERSSFSGHARYSYDHSNDPRQFVRSTAYLAETESSRTAGLGVDLNNESWLANVELQQSLQSDDWSLSSVMESGLLMNGDGVSVVQHPQLASGVVLDVGGQIDSDYEVLVNGRKARLVNSRWESGVALQPYKTYQVGIVPKGDQLFQFDNNVQQVTLYPGNVASLKWDMRKVFVVIGQLLDKEDNPVSNARITNTQEYSATDENGWFQVELEQGGVLEVTTNQGKRCHAVLPETIGQNDVEVVDSLYCLAQ